VEIEVTVLFLPIYTEHPENSTFGLIVNRDVLGDPLRILYGGFNQRDAKPSATTSALVEIHAVGLVGVGVIIDAFYQVLKRWLFERSFGCVRLMATGRTGEK
jgi:hypothetical protein